MILLWKFFYGSISRQLIMHYGMRLELYTIHGKCLKNNVQHTYSKLLTSWLEDTVLETKYVQIRQSPDVTFASIVKRSNKAIFYNF